MMLCTEFQVFRSKTVTRRFGTDIRTYRHTATQTPKTGETRSKPKFLYGLGTGQYTLPVCKTALVSEYNRFLQVSGKVPVSPSAFQHHVGFDKFIFQVSIPAQNNLNCKPRLANFHRQWVTCFLPVVQLLFPPVPFFQLRRFRKLNLMKYIDVDKQ